MIDKLRDCFYDQVVYKDLQKDNFFKSLSLPSFLRDWVLHKFQNDDGTYSIEEISDFVKQYIPQKKDWLSIKNRIIVDYDRVTLLTKIIIDIDIKTGHISFDLPAFGLTKKETIIESDVWAACADKLMNGQEVWGLVTLGYRFEEKGKSRIKLVDFQDFQPYTVDLDYFKDVRNDFNVREWIDVILGAMDYNADGFDNIDQKLAMITRMLPFVEKRVNLIELAPKGTGKSYVYGGINRHGYLAAGTMSRAKLFYDIARKAPGLIYNYDYVAFDEIQKLAFSNSDEISSTLKGYMEQGTISFAGHTGTADAGVILLGNIKQDNMNIYLNMFEELPEVFKESALLDRFHGFVCGWDIPRLNDDMKVKGWALNSEYFCSILHELRNDVTYRAIVDELIEVPEKADTRDTEAIKRLATAYLKLLFPNVTSVEDVNPNEFYTYCLKPASRMRDIIKIQLGIIDKEYAGKGIPSLKIKEAYGKN